MTNFLSFDKILYHPEQLVAVKKQAPAFPIHATISLGNFCNHKCLWCTAFEYQLKKAKLIDFDSLIVFLRKAAFRGLRAVTYIGNGEPTVYPKFKELVNAVADLGLEQGMFTNGFLLNRYEQEILEHFTWIRVSLDAGSKEIHDKMHGVSEHFDTIINNMERLVNIRTNTMPTIGVQYALHHENYDDLYRSAAISKNSGVDYFSIKPVFDRGSVGTRVDKNRLSAADMAVGAEKVVSDLQSETFTVFYRPYQVQSQIEGRTVFDYKKCVAGYFNITIYEDGKLIYCGPNRISIGTINDDLDSIEKNIKKLSSKLDLTRCPAGCRYHELNAKIDNIIDAEKIAREKHINFL